MQQKLTQRMTRLLAAAGAALLLTQAAWAAAYEVPWDETCPLHSEDFTAGQTVDGILIRSVPTAADGSFCYGSRALRAGDVLPASALDAITLRPAAQRRRSRRTASSRPTGTLPITARSRSRAAQRAP